MTNYIDKKILCFSTKKGFLSCLCLFFTIGVTSVFAKGVSPYLPIKTSPLLENEIERLAIVAGIPNLVKPYSLATVVEHMEKIQDTYPHLYNRLKIAIKPYKNKIAVTQFSASANYSNEHHAIPNAHGSFSNSHLQASFRSQWQINDWLALYAGGNFVKYVDNEFTSDRANGNELESIYQPSGSMLSMGVDWAQLDIGYKDIWLSPFQGSAQLLSTQAQTMPSISLSNNLPIETFGIKWSYMGFLSQMSRQDVQFRPGEFSNKDKPLLAGLHFSIQPTEWWSVGASRVFQFAGGERPISFSTLARAFFDPRGADNDASVDEESGNQIAAISSKMNFDGSMPFSFALEIAGEDTSNNKAYQLGNTAITAGLFFPYFLSEDISVNYEYSNWQNGWYRNNVYRSGYVNEGFVLGHWAMQAQRDLDIAVEGTSHYINAHWQLENYHTIVASVRISKHQDTASIDFKDAWELQLDYVVPWKDYMVTIAAYAGQNNFGESFSQLRISLDY